MIDILNLTFPELERFIVEDLGQPKFRAAQVWQWIWQKHATSFDAMTDVSKQLRAKLAEVAEIVLPEIVTVQTSCDGTEKLLLRLRDGALVETVILPSTGQDGSVRIAQCVSSQIGCAMGCTFCSTGTMGFIRNMTAGEILSQVLVARMRLGDNRIDHPIIRNLVFMGMGEPLLNLRETTRALEMLNHDKGMDFSPRRITVSTCGIKAGLRELGDSGLAFLAVSLHAPNQDLRAKIMPKAANWHLDDLMATLESYPLKTREHITFEYLLLGGVNDQPEHARELAKLVSRVKGKLNLIAYNPSETQLYKAPTEADILAFEKILWSKGVTAILRKSKGQDIKAACGQLKSDWEREKGTESKIGGGRGTFLKKGSPSPPPNPSLSPPKTFVLTQRRMGRPRHPVSEACNVSPETQQKTKGPHRDAGLFHRQNRSVSPKANPLKRSLFSKSKKR